MHLKTIKIKNFRKLKSCILELDKKQTVLVGANNSGKTAAITAIKYFLKDKQLNALDFTVTNWKEINNLALKWITSDTPTLEDDKILLRPYCPTMDVWIEVKDFELHYVSHLIPTLDWEIGQLGVRLCFEPKNIEDLYKDFKEACEKASILKDIAKNQHQKDLKLFPRNLKEFLEKNINKYFGISAYLIDPKIEEDATIKEFDNNYYQCQLTQAPFNDLIKIDLIDANRGFSDEGGESYGTGGLTEQSKSLFDKYLDPTLEPNKEDIVALSAIEEARNSFDEKLNTSFEDIKKEINTIGYPGFTDPQIKMATKINLSESLQHESSVKLNVLGQIDDIDENNFLPEKYNGLGYQNLISMVLKLIRFRYDWMREKKANNSESQKNAIPPLQLVLVEEPEAHLHAQVQQVFANKAYSILRNHERLGDSEKFTTQMIISTHSSHIAHEISFDSLRYFKKNKFKDETCLPCCQIVNLSNVFGSDEETKRFVTRYIKLTHCDLFFADATILVEGAAEKILLPDFIKNSTPLLENNYITILEIGGSHAHRLKPLIETLGILTLIITDIDAVDVNGKHIPQRNMGLKTNNDTLKNWLPKKEAIDELLELKREEKKSKDEKIMVCYQTPINTCLNGEKIEEILPYTFEDSLIYSNLNIFKKFTIKNGFSKKMIEAINSSDIKEAQQQIFDELKNLKKAEVAINLLYLDNTENLLAPVYIQEGLKFLSSKLNNIDDASSEKEKGLQNAIN